MQNELAVRAPSTLHETSEDWAKLDEDARRQRAAAAVRDDDAAELVGLVKAYTLTFGRAGLATSANTLAQYGRSVEWLVAWTQAQGLKIHQLGNTEAHRYRAHLQAHMKPASAKVRIATCRVLWRALAWAGVCKGTDPFAGVRVDDPVQAWAKRAAYTEDEFTRMLEAARGRERLVLLLCGDAALRADEAAHLQWRDVQSDGKLRVTGKGGRTDLVGMTQRLRQALEAERQAEGQVLGISRQRVGQLLRQCAKRAGVESAGRGVHGLRHRAGTRVYETTHDLLVTARHLRHASTQHTERYAKASANGYNHAVASLETPDSTGGER